MRVTSTFVLSFILGSGLLLRPAAAASFMSPLVSDTVLLGQTTELNSSASENTASPLSRFKDLADGLHSVAMVIALIIGGWWTYTRFIKRREEFPRAQISHSVIHRRLDDNFQLVHVTVNVKNLGEVLLRLDKGSVWIQQVIPPQSKLLQALRTGQEPEKVETEFAWPLVGEHKLDWQNSAHELEPGEDENMEFDFAVGSDVATVEVYSYFRNETKSDREIGWNLSTIYDLNDNQTVEEGDDAQGKNAGTSFLTEKKKMTQIHEFRQAGPKSRPKLLRKIAQAPPKSTPTPVPKRPPKG